MNFKLTYPPRSPIILVGQSVGGFFWSGKPISILSDDKPDGSIVYDKQNDMVVIDEIANKIRFKMKPLDKPDNPGVMYSLGAGNWRAYNILDSENKKILWTVKNIPKFLQVVHKSAPVRQVFDIKGKLLYTVNSTAPFFSPPFRSIMDSSGLEVGTIKNYITDFDETKINPIIALSLGTLGAMIPLFERGGGKVGVGQAFNEFW